MRKYVIGLVCLMMSAASFGGDLELPRVFSVGTVSPDTLLVIIRAQRIERGSQAPYYPEPGDEVADSHYRFVRRDGKLIGMAVDKGQLLFSADRLHGEPLDLEWAANPASYRIVSPDDARFAKGVAPDAVYRKSRPYAFARVSEDHPAAQDHLLFLKLPEPLGAGKRYTIEFQDGHLQTQSAEYYFDPTARFSEAVHASQIGFRPDDPAKVAFLSCWMGDGGGLSYPEGLAFSLIDVKTGKPVFEGKTRLDKRATEVESTDDHNYEKADVYEMDFSSFNTPGVYRVSVEGVGCSFPFPINDDAWMNAFYVSIRGLFHQRSGIALGPPYTDYVRPRSFHPDDGVVVHSARPGTRGFAGLDAGNADDVVPDAWGGYMDAGDWDRRPVHIYIPLLLLDLCDMAHNRFDALDLNMPESTDNLPDVLNEALWEVDFCQRLQTPEGGIRTGINSTGHPRMGESSWQESLDVFAYAPEANMSYNYASVAMHAAALVEKKDPAKAKAYRDTATKAYEWAEQNSSGRAGGGRAGRGGGGGQDTARALAAVEFFRQTGDAKWQDIFLASTKYTDPQAAYRGPTAAGSRYDPQDEAAWIYFQTDRPGMDESVKANFKRALLADADEKIKQIESTAFRWVARKGKDIAYSNSVIPDVISLVRAHYVTKDKKYLRAVELACQHGVGANPLNMCYTNGVGIRNQTRQVHEDSLTSHQPLPPGITVNGPYDPIKNIARNHRTTAVNFRRYVYPEATTWPALEAWYDVGVLPPMNEFSVHRNIAPNAYAWGYLAARP